MKNLSLDEAKGNFLIDKCASRSVDIAKLIALLLGKAFDLDIKCFFVKKHLVSNLREHFTNAFVRLSKKAFSKHLLKTLCKCKCIKINFIKSFLKASVTLLLWRSGLLL